MKHTIVEINGNPVSVSSLDHDVEPFLESALYKRWLAKLDPGIIVKTILVDSVDINHRTKDLIFAKITVGATDSQGRTLPGIIFLRGDSVAILTLIKVNGEDHSFVFVVQPRLAIGQLESVEIPAGMLDGDGNLVGVAAKEIREELGIEVNEKNLLNLNQHTPNGVALSPGGCDERMHFYSLEIDYTEEQMLALNDKLTGAADEHEYIRLKLVPVGEMEKYMSDAKFSLALFLRIVMD